MPRIIVCLILFAIVSIVPVFADQVGYLGEMRPWPMLCAGVPILPLDLSDSPLETLVGPVCAGECSYALIPVGNGNDPGISVVIWNEENPRILVDTNNNEDLGDESGVYAREQIFLHAFTWSFNVDVEYEVKGTVHTVPYHLSIIADYSYETEKYRFLAGGFCQRRGGIELSGSFVPIAITDLSSTARYNDVSQLVVAIDTDGDGKLDTLPGSHEVYKPGGPLQVGDVLYEITYVSVDGRTIALKEAGAAIPRAILKPGRQVPDFATVAIGGSSFWLSDFLGKVVILLFQPRVNENGCVNCPSTGYDRLTAISKGLEEFGNEVVIIVVATEKKPVQEQWLAYIEGSNILGVWDPAVTELYHSKSGLLIVDQHGVIKAMDEAWFTYKQGRPKGYYYRLNEIEICDIVGNLVK
ncbi:MAG TPA: hypothetical protein DHW70_02630 [Candidatus Atribacteria bacterium]|nr:hypothetical protein [Candidatus Atribacteria bacterium]